MSAVKVISVKPVITICKLLLQNFMIQDLMLFYG
jgi:hypothetical protein